MLHLSLRGSKKVLYCGVKTAERDLLPTYLDERVAKISIGRISREIRAKWLVAVVFEGTTGEFRISQVTRTKQINWWGYGFEMIIQEIYNDMKEITETIELSDATKLAVILEGRFPTCYSCGKKGHKENVPLTCAREHNNRNTRPQIRNRVDSPGHNPEHT